MHRASRRACVLGAVVTLLVATSQADASGLPLLPPPVTTPGPLSVTVPGAIQANAPFSMKVRLTDAYGNTITTATDRIYVTINRIGAQSALMSGGMLTFNNLRATTTPVTIVVTDPQRNLNRTVYVAAGVSGTAPFITSPSSAIFSNGAYTEFVVTTNGSPNPAIAITPALPAGLSFHDNGDGTATLSGVPAPGTEGTYNFQITAFNGVSPSAAQSFTLTIATAPRDVRYAVVGTAPSRRIVITWNNMALYPGNPDLGTFQVILNEGSNKIVFQHLSMSGASVADDNSPLSNASVGLNKDTSTFVELLESQVNPVPNPLPPGTPAPLRYEFQPNATSSYDAVGPLLGTWDTAADIGAPGSTRAAPIGDDTVGGNIFPQGFSFLYFGSPVNQIFVSSNGFFRFDQPDDEYDNYPIGSFDGLLVAPFWDDLWTNPYDDSEN